MKTHHNLFTTLAMTAKSNIKEFEVEEVKNISGSILIDVREESEWKTGCLPNAIHLSKGVIERDIEKIIPDTNTAIVLYCSGGYRSAIAAESLQQMGYKNVVSMKGGTTAWIQAGFELEIK
jgi:rhodanese-related sulfurtransferase